MLRNFCYFSLVIRNFAPAFTDSTLGQRPVYIPHSWANCFGYEIELEWQHD